MKKTMRNTLLATTALGFLFAGPVHAADNSTAEAIKALQAQVNALQKQLGDMQAKEATRAAEDAAKPAAVAAAAPAASSKDTAGSKEILPGVSVKLGGYIEADGIYRSKNQTSDSTSSLNTSIPWGNTVNAHTDEFRGSARPSRLSLLATGSPDKDMDLAAYFEMDFMGSGTGSNSVQSNSYVPRFRQAYATVDRNDWGSHFLVGQSYSLVTPFKSGITARKEALPMVIDSAFFPGITYDRNPGVRYVQEFADKKLNFGLSLESPQVNFGGITPPATVTANNTGGSSLNTSGTASTKYSTDYAPDIIAKLAADTSLGHYEAFGLVRFFRDVINANFHNNYRMGYGGGLQAFVPVVKDKLELQGGVSAGKGMGRYNAAQLPDFAFNSAGGIKPLTEMGAMFGVIGHPTKRLDLYAYAGAEKVLREDEYSSGSYGYGDSNLNNANCFVANGSCSAQTQMVWSFTPGLWVTAYDGSYGNMKIGGQYEFIRRDSFTGLNNLAPHATDHIGMVSFRYAPFN